MDGSESCSLRPFAALPPPSSAGPACCAVPEVFLFPAGNAFHGSCLCAEAAELAPAAKRRIKQLAERPVGMPEALPLVPANADAPVAGVA
ncbi:hypothetical protein ABPG77_003072 [Micractinium sp. CCAP 211/92]